MANRRHGVQVAKWEFRASALSSEFGQGLAARWFGLTVEQLAALMGTYSRGPRKGLPKGYVAWLKVTEGGWNYEGQSVLRPGIAAKGLMDNDSRDLAFNQSFGEIYRGISVPKAPADPVPMTDLERERAAKMGYEIPEGI